MPHLSSAQQPNKQRKRPPRHIEQPRACYFSALLTFLITKNPISLIPANHDNSLFPENAENAGKTAAGWP